MTAIAKAFVNAIPAISPDVDILKTVAMFCGAGLFFPDLRKLWSRPKRRIFLDPDRRFSRGFTSAIVASA
jgi:hypothetical protein